MMDWLSSNFSPGPVFGWLCLLGVCLLPVPWIRFGKKSSTSTIRFSLVGSLTELSPSLAWRVRFILPALRTLALIALVVALARPQSGGSYQSQREGIAIQMVLDISGSMGEKDFVMDGRNVRRLDAVKRVFEDFVLGRGDLQGRENDLIGMTTFAMFADTRCPLTVDHGSLRDLLVETDIPGFINGQQVRQDEEAGFTALGDAITVATDDLRRAGEKAVAGVPGAEAAKSKVMILLTDGRDNPANIPGTTPPDPIEAARIAAQFGIKIYTIGAVGAARVRNQGTFGFIRSRGRDVDEDSLQRIADMTGGKYFRATDVNSLITIYDEIDRLERKVTGQRTYQDNIEAARLAMMVGLGLLFFEWLLTHTRYRKIP